MRSLALSWDCQTWLTPSPPRLAHLKSQQCLQEVTVDTLGTDKTPEGYLVTHFQTVFRNAQTGTVIEKQEVRDFHEKVDQYYLLTERTIRSTQQGNPEEKLAADTLIRFNNIQPL